MRKYRTISSLSKHKVTDNAPFEFFATKLKDTKQHKIFFVTPIAIGLSDLVPSWHIPKNYEPDILSNHYNNFNQCNQRLYLRMSEKEWYKDWFNSPFYHKLYFERDEKEAEAFIKKLVEHLNPPPGSRILDVACGKGRHSKILASLGFDVTGIDLSADSIAFAKQFEKDNLDFYVHDMRLPFWANYFDYAFNFFTSFGYFKTRREHDDAIRTITGSLKPGGIFVIDYLNVHCAEKNIRHNEIKKIGDTTYDIHRWDDETHFYKKITITDASLKEPLTCTERVAKLSPGDFTDMLSFQGMQVKEVFGDYQLNRYDVKNTARLIIVAKKTCP